MLRMGQIARIYQETPRVNVCQIFLIKGNEFKVAVINALLHFWLYFYGCTQSHIRQYLFYQF